MNEPFAAFCNRIAAPIRVHIADGNYTLPDEFDEIAPKLVAKLRAKKSSFPTHPITFIQSMFANIDDVVKELEEKTTDGEIPDGLIIYYAYNMYTERDADGNPIPGKEVSYNNLPDSLQNIIKIMAVYTILL